MGLRKTQVVKNVLKWVDAVADAVDAAAAVADSHGGDAASALSNWDQNQ